MKRTLIYLSLAFCSVLGLLVFGVGIHLAQLAVRWYTLAFMVTGLSLVFIFALVVAYSLASIITALRRTGRSWVKGSWSHNRYMHSLTRRHRRHPVVDLEGLPSLPHLFLSELYLRLYTPSNALITRAAESIFFHTAISQSGYLDILVVRRTQLRLINDIAHLYHPRPGLKILPALYADIMDATLTPSNQQELDLGAQIGPAIVGASVVGAIPGANLVSVMIADAVIQGSSNALATLRIGLLARRYFHRMIEGGPLNLETERRAVTQEALDMLSPLVTDASGTLSRAIWDATKSHLRRIPAATYESLKSLMARSVRGLTRRRKGAQSKADSDSLEDVPSPKN